MGEYSLKAKLPKAVQDMFQVNKKVDLKKRKILSWYEIQLIVYT